MDEPRAGAGSRVPVGTLGLLALLVAVYSLRWITRRYWGEPHEILIFYRLHDHPVAFWGYLTSVFSHKLTSPFGHFGLNFIGAALLGWHVESRWGWRTMWLCFTVGGVGSGVLQAMVAPGGQSLGASGAVLALLGFALLSPAGPGWMRVPEHIWRLAYVVLWISFAITWYASEAGSGVGHSAHLFGFTLGGIFVWTSSQWPRSSG